VNYDDGFQHPERPDERGYAMRYQHPLCLHVCTCVCFRTGEQLVTIVGGVEVEATMLPLMARDTSWLLLLRAADSTDSYL